MNDKIVAVIHAKVEKGWHSLMEPLRGLGYASSLEFLIGRLRASKIIKDIILAIPNELPSSPLIKIGRKAEIKVYAGEDDLFPRFIKVAEKFHADHIVRIPGENIMISPKLIDIFVRHHLDCKSDFTRGDGYPVGLVAEIFKVDTLIRIAPHCREDDYRHWPGRIFQDCRSIFRIKDISAPANMRHAYLRIDAKNIKGIENFLLSCPQRDWNNDIKVIEYLLKNEIRTAPYSRQECLHRVETYHKVNQSDGLGRGYYCCGSCGVVFASPIYSDDGIKKRYTGAYFKEILKSGGHFIKEGKPNHLLYQLTHKHYFELVNFKINRREGKFLELGCAIGSIVAYFSELGWESWGVDVSSWAIRYGKKYFGLKRLYADSVEKLKLPDNYFDIVALIHILEHLRDPYKTLETAYRTLKPGGKIFIEVPDFERSREDLYNKDHFWFFTEGSLKNWLKKIGFGRFIFKREGIDCHISNLPFLFLSAEK
ncbi:MAG: methyltransferase domain-containing protein [Nitrospinae bacterium]|nr:methyltransferase domain-containing protein [Nitrospinota bacterium]